MWLKPMLQSIGIVADYWILSDMFSPIEGFLDPIEGYALFMLAEQGPGVGCILEIGSFAGRSTSYLAYGSKRARREKVVAVDHFLGSPEHRGGDESAFRMNGCGLYEMFRKNLRLAGVEDWVHTIKAGSEEACVGWSHPIRLLFIDGDHSAEASRRDFELWSPWLIPEGLVAFHDIGMFPGVTSYYETLLAQGAVLEILSVGTLRVVTKTPV
ncbi:MAG: hypothetical protein CVU73_02430 [Deltaproteobacteria bacterium HGW-Deltaproteobacteria-8]|jgi:predicted O-methyltransferase YrrM|nr:MAG: hypothetical protein CVU73_02430 [Deltaproteobacteria bacterium HGW-Deltaproteobacteria-8]